MLEHLFNFSAWVGTKTQFSRWEVLTVFLVFNSEIQKLIGCVRCAGKWKYSWQFFVIVVVVVNGFEVAEI